jgi:hypothetical protein
MARKIERAAQAPAVSGAPGSASELSQWPVQIKLVPVRAPYLDGAHLLVAADCAAYAYAAFHRDFIKGRVALIGCPKLDSGDYTEKLTAILAENDIKSLTIARMGGALLRRPRARGDRGPARERKVHPLAGGHHRDGRLD